LALEFFEYCRKLSRRIDRRASAISDQLPRAATSIVANVGEALDEPSFGDKRRFLRYALRSAGECERLVAGARRVGAIGERDAEIALRHLRDIKMDLLRLIRWTRT
jgi:four helix bundle protein